MKINRSLLTVLAITAMASLAQAGNTEAVNDVLKLKSSGFNDDAIIAFIKGKNTNYNLSADEAIVLSRQGVPPAVLNAMMSSGAPAYSAPTPYGSSVAPQPAVVQPVAQLQPLPVQPSVPPQYQPPYQVTAPSVTVQQPALPPDAAYFHQELTPYGRWILAEDSQWYWQPTVAAGNPAWRPYWDNGHWVYTDYGWFWSSDYPWGWAAFHYGRWQLHPHHGWLWFPDQTWGPAWVAWRQGGDYCGWSPLPPGVVYESGGAAFLFHGKRVGLEFDFGLGVDHFSFCMVKDLGTPTLRHLPTEHEHTIFRQTAIVTRYSTISVKGDAQRRIVNRGIDVERVKAVRGVAVETIHVQDIRTPVNVGHSQDRMDAKSHTIEVYRPKMENHDHDRKSWWSR